MRNKSKLIIGGLAAAVFALATPVWAHGGPGQWNPVGYGHGKHWHKHQVHERVVVREYWHPVPVYPRVVYPVYPAYPAPAPGIHVVVPNIYIPFR
jgi:hypothetical protein